MECPYHPIATLIRMITLNLDLKFLCRSVIPGLEGLTQMRQLLNSRGLNKLLIIEMVKQKIQSFLRILDLRCKCCWCFGSNTLHVLA